MTPTQITAAAEHLAAMISRADGDTARKLGLIASGVGAIAVADEHGAIVFEDDPTAALRLVLAREEAAAILIDYLTTVQRLGVRGLPVSDLIGHLINRLDRIRAAAVAGVEG